MEPTAEVYQQICQISTCPPGKSRSAYVQALARTFNLSASTVYRWHREICKHEAEQNRKIRSDKGSRSLSDDQAHLLASLIWATKRKSNKILMSTQTAQEIAADNNLGLPEVSAATVNRRLRELRLSKAKMKEPSPHINLITEHPNQLWQFDVSNCIQYFLPDSPAGERKDLETGPEIHPPLARSSDSSLPTGLQERDKELGEEDKEGPLLVPSDSSLPSGLQERDVEMEIYKNKLGNVRTIKKELLRYLVVDHCSGAFYLEYFYTSGETALNAAEFFLSAFRKKEDERYRFHGVPFNLYLDRGSAVQTDTVQNLLAKLNVRCLTHLPGNPRAKGLVEGLHDYVERNFECRLKFHRPRSLDEMNAWALDWIIRINAVQPFRGAAPRSQLWSLISRDQLRLCPPDDIYRKLLVSKPESRKVGGDLKISYQGKIYIVPDPNLKGEEVEVTYSPYEFPKISVFHPCLELPICLAPCQEPDQFGRITDGAVLFQMGEDGKPNYRRHADTATQKGIKAAEKTLSTFGLTMKGTGDKRRTVSPAVGEEKLKVFGHQADKVGNVAYLDRPGIRLPIEKMVEIQTALPRIKAVKIVIERLGRSLQPQESEWIENTYGATVPEEEIETIVNLLQRKEGKKAWR